jgi:F-type H+-transporting ATPase subunit epsilon
MATGHGTGSLFLDVVTPTRKLLEGVVVPWVKMPGAEGELEVLPGHVDLMTVLGTGELAFPTDGGGTRRFAISYGFAEVQNDRVIVLAETCEEAASIDRARAARAESKAKEQLAGTLSPDEFKKYQLKLQRAILRQRVSGGI